MLHNCLGFAALGECEYNPANPSNIYFSLGEAIAALAFTLAVPQFVKPIYRMRLRARRISIRWLFLLVFSGASAVAVAAVLPSLPLDRDWAIAYPIDWELFAACLFVLAYGLLAFGSLTPVKARQGKFWNFANAAAHFLSEARDRDYDDFATGEFAANLERLLQAARFVERLSPSTTTAFFDFTYRTQIADGRYASSFLTVAADPEFCRAIVERRPWLVAYLLGTMRSKGLGSRAFERFVQTVARYALISDQGIMAREVGYGGFRAAPLLSESLFGDIFILRTYQPLDGLQFADFRTPTAAFVGRLNRAVELSLGATLKEGRFWQAHHQLGVQEAYESLYREINAMKIGGALGVDLTVASSSGLPDRISQLRQHLALLPSERRQALYAPEDAKDAPFDLVEIYAETWCEALFAIANDFAGPSDRLWFIAHSLWRAVFPFERNGPPGMDPLQQRVALKLRDKVRENMEGWYPAATKLLLALVGPYRRDETVSRSALTIMEDVLYSLLRDRLKALALQHPEKLSTFLPGNVTFDVKDDSLTHTYLSGERILTKLGALQLGSVSLAREFIAQ